MPRVELGLLTSTRAASLLFLWVEKPLQTQRRGSVHRGQSRRGEAGGPAARSVLPAPGSREGLWLRDPLARALGPQVGPGWRGSWVAACKPSFVSISGKGFHKKGSESPELT